jgi:hypothetical protein
MDGSIRVTGLYVESARVLDEAVACAPWRNVMASGPLFEDSGTRLAHIAIVVIGSSSHLLKSLSGLKFFPDLFTRPKRLFQTASSSWNACIGCLLSASHCRSQATNLETNCWILAAKGRTKDIIP